MVLLWDDFRLHTTKETLRYWWTDHFSVNHHDSSPGINDLTFTKQLDLEKTRYKYTTQSQVNVLSAQPANASLDSRQMMPNIKSQKPWRLLESTFLLLLSSPFCLFALFLSFFLTDNSTKPHLNLCRTSTSQLCSAERFFTLFLNGVFSLNLATLSPNPFRHV